VKIGSFTCKAGFSSSFVGTCYVQSKKLMVVKVLMLNITFYEVAAEKLFAIIFVEKKGATINVLYAKVY
jgi:hypothetical protein